MGQIHAGDKGGYMVRLSSDGWMSGRLLVAVTPFARWRGIKAAAGAEGVLLRTRSVHGFGLRDPLATIAISSDGVVVSRELLRPGRVIVVPGARWIAEVPPGSILPDPGSRLTLHPSLG